MIIGFSTSSAWTSVAAIDSESGKVLWHGSENAPQGASGACLILLEKMLAEASINVQDAKLFAADIGPGSFTGVRVGVTLAKTLGYLNGRQVAGASSFDLISIDRTVVLPSKKGEFFIRTPGFPAFRQSALPEAEYVGFGPEVEPQTYPDAGRFSLLVGLLHPVDAAAFVPEYLIEPSISIPKKPFSSSVEPNG